MIKNTNVANELVSLQVCLQVSLGAVGQEHNIKHLT